MLKAELHTHTQEDPLDDVDHTAPRLIATAAAKGVRVLSITNHQTYLYCHALADYAAQRDVLLIPGIELSVNGKHVVVLNCPPEVERVRTFADLKAFKSQNPKSFVLAPHPYYPQNKCLGDDLVEHLDLFDGIEYCHFYFAFFNPFNHRATAVAKRYGKPLIGTSDAHHLFQLDTTHALIDADWDVDSVIGAMKAGEVELVSQPAPVIRSVWRLLFRNCDLEERSFDYRPLKR